MKRFFKALRFAAILFGGLLAVLLIYLGVSNWRANVRLEAKLAELRAAGQTLRMADLARNPIPPETNAATYLRRAKGDIEAIGIEIAAAWDVAPKADYDAFDDDGRLSLAMIGPIRAAIDAYPNAVPRILQAADCPDYDSQMDYTVDVRAFVSSLPMTQTRGSIRVLNYESLLLSADGKADEALQTATSMFRLTRHFDRDPTLVCHLVSLACRTVAIGAANTALRSGQVSTAAHDSLEAELARHDLVAAARHALETERALGLEYFQDTFHWISKIGPVAPWLKVDRCNYLDAIDAAIASVPYFDRRGQAKFTEIVDNSGVLTRLVAPAIQAWLEANCRVAAEMRCLRVLNAVTRGESANERPEPKLEDLGLPRGVTVDPYNGQPLHLKKLPEGWLVYSVGRDLKDDGGKLTDNIDVGLGPKPPTTTNVEENEPHAVTD
jgi:hypothetical protein